MAPAVERVVAVGASNLTRGFQTVVATARVVWGQKVEIVAALGHGRSYGARSRLLGRALPGILECGLWPALESMRQARTLALVTDVGNDILYGSSPEQTLGWVEETVRRLQSFTGDIVLTNLPIAGIRRMSRARFLFFRSLFFPSCRIPFARVIRCVEQLDGGLVALAAAQGLRLAPLNPDWYGFDPIHIRPSLWRPAWQEILGRPGLPAGAPARREAMRLYFMRPERRWLFGVEQYTGQAGVVLPSGGRLWLY